MTTILEANQEDSIQVSQMEIEKNKTISEL